MQARDGERDPLVFARAGVFLRRHWTVWIKAALYAWLAYVALFVDIAPCWGACIEWQLTTQCANGTVEYCRTTSPDCADCYLNIQCIPGGWTSRRCDCYAWSNPDSLSVSGRIDAIACGIEGWCRGGATLTLEAVDGASPPHSVRIFSSPGSGLAFDCGWGTNPCYQSLPEGQGTVVFQAECSGGLTTDPPGSLVWKLDLGAPIVSYALAGGVPGSGGWYRGGPVILNCAADDGLSGIPAGGLSYGARTADGDGTHTLSCTATDRAGNTADAYAVVLIDGTPPEISASVSGGKEGGGGWYLSGPVNLGCAAADAGSGVAGVSYGRLSAVDPGTTILDCAATDNAGNSASYSTSVSIDNVAPSGKFAIAGEYCSGGWYRSPVRISLLIDDAHSGPAGGSFTVDGADWSADKTVGDGVHALAGVVRDAAGNSAAVSGSVQVDTVPPATLWTAEDGAWVGGTAVLEGNSADFGSGVALVEISFDGGETWTAIGKQPRWSLEWNTADPERPFADGPAPLLARAADNACNTEAPVRLTVNVDNTDPDLFLRDSLILMGNSTVFSAHDGGSGLAAMRATISGNGIVPRVLDFPPADGAVTVEWDGRGGDLRAAPFGVYEVLFEAWDRVGNHSSAAGSWVRPFPKAPADPVVPLSDPIDGGVGAAGPADGRTAFGAQAPSFRLLLPFWAVLLPLAALGVWLAGSQAALVRDRRWSELRAIGAAAARYRERKNTFYTEEGEDD